MNKRKMKKYFMQENDEELELGDQIVLDLTEDMENGHVKHRHLDCKFVPDLIPMLLEEGIIREEEVDDEEADEDPLDFRDDEDEDDCGDCESCPMFLATLGSHETLAEKMDKLQDTVGKIAGVIAMLSDTFADLTKAVTKQKPKKNGRKQEN